MGVIAGDYIGHGGSVGSKRDFGPWMWVSHDATAFDEEAVGGLRRATAGSPQSHTGNPHAADASEAKTPQPPPEEVIGEDSVFFTFCFLFATGAKDRIFNEPVPKFLLYNPQVYEHTEDNRGVIEKDWYFIPLLFL